MNCTSSLLAPFVTSMVRFVKAAAPCSLGDRYVAQNHSRSEMGVAGAGLIISGTSAPNRAHWTAGLAPLPPGAVWNFHPITVSPDLGAGAVGQSNP